MQTHTKLSKDQSNPYFDILSRFTTFVSILLHSCCLIMTELLPARSQPLCGVEVLELQCRPGYEGHGQSEDTKYIQH